MEQLSDTCSAEKQLLRAMLRMAKKASALSRKDGQQHVEQSEGGQRGRRPACSAAGAEQGALLPPVDRQAAAARPQQSRGRQILRLLAHQNGGEEVRRQERQPH
jgi:hypothetical protein